MAGEIRSVGFALLDPDGVPVVACREASWLGWVGDSEPSQRS